jgi:regulatory protein
MISQITKIEATRNKDRVNVYVDGEYSFSTSLEILFKYKLNLNSQIDLEKIKAVAYEDNYLKGKEYALKLIEGSSKTKKQIIDKLVTKGYDQNIINRIINFTDEYNLMAKGIPQDIIANKLASIDINDEVASARSLAIKKYNTLRKSEEDNKKLCKKLGDFLIRKGYSLDITKKIVSEILNEENIEFE